MRNNKAARVLSIALAGLMLVSGGAFTIINLLKSKPISTSSLPSEVSSENSGEPHESQPEESKNTSVPEEEHLAPTFSAIYTQNLVGNLLTSYDSLCMTIRLYFPDGTSYWYSRFAAKEENGYAFHYIDADGQEESIRPNEIFRTDSDGSIQFQVAYQPELESDIIPYIINNNAYYYEPTEEMISCIQKGRTYYITSRLDMAQDEYYGNNWGYTEGIAEATYLVDTETLAIQSISLAYDGKTMMETTVEYNCTDAASPMMDKVNAAEAFKNITIYYDYGGDEETAYLYTVPSNTAFFYSQPEGFTMYLDPEGTEPMAEADGNDARLTVDEVSLYLIQNT